MTRSHRNKENDSPSSSSSSLSIDPAAPPRGVVRKRGHGWGGEELEINHRLEQQSREEPSKHASVDISQFQNTEVGSGYQAKHVVRQQKLSISNAPIIDMTRNDKTEKEHKKKDKKEKKRRRKENSSTKDDDEKSSKGFSKYMKSPEMRKFRIELETFLS